MRTHNKQHTNGRIALGHASNESLLAMNKSNDTHAHTYMETLHNFKPVLI